MEKRKDTILTVSSKGFEMLHCISLGLGIAEARKVTRQSYQAQQSSINNLLKAHAIERVGRGKYQLTEFGHTILNEFFEEWR